MRQLRDIGRVVVLAALIFAPALVSGQTAGQTTGQTASQTAGQTTGQTRGGFPDLVAALKATPGCLGVETARTSSGKQVIFAWFENKKAVLAWYYSDTHQAVKKM